MSATLALHGSATLLITLAKPRYSSEQPAKGSRFLRLFRRRRSAATSHASSAPRSVPDILARPLIRRYPLAFVTVYAGHLILAGLLGFILCKVGGEAWSEYVWTCGTFWNASLSVSSPQTWAVYRLMAIAAPLGPKTMPWYQGPVTSQRPHGDQPSHVHSSRAELLARPTRICRRPSGPRRITRACPCLVANYAPIPRSYGAQALYVFLTLHVGFIWDTNPPKCRHACSPQN